MSIGPVQNFGPVTEAPPAKASPPADSSHTTANQHLAAERVAQPETGNLPTQEQTGTRNVPSPAELPQDEVQVQRDPQIRDEVVIQYVVTATGSLILQVPSAQVLSVRRGIDQEFQQQAKARESAGTAAALAAKGEEPHGH